VEAPVAAAGERHRLVRKEPPSSQVVR